jgi:hypothetical protein
VFRACPFSKESLHFLSERSYRFFDILYSWKGWVTVGTTSTSLSCWWKINFLKLVSIISNFFFFRHWLRQTKLTCLYLARLFRLIYKARVYPSDFIPSLNVWLAWKRVAKYKEPCLLSSAAGFKPLNLGWWVNCSTTAGKQSSYICFPFFFLEYSKNTM